MARRPPLEGIPGREADAAQRGFFYQALVAALAWVRLQPNEELLIESPEDLTVAADGAADLRQVKDRADTLTLNGVIGWLGTVVQLQARNPDYELTFAYISTSTIGLERAKKDQPNGNAGLDEWNAVKAGQPPAALVSVLRRLAARDKDLAAFLSQRTDEQVVTELVSRVTWAVAAPRVAQIEQELAEAIAELAYAEFGEPKSRGRQLMDRLVQHVFRRSTQRSRDQRRLTYADLLEFVRPLVAVAMTSAEYARLLQRAALVEAVPVELLTARITERTTRLRQSRFFTEARPTEQAAELATAVLPGGSLELGSAAARSEALCWCARMIANEDRTQAQSWLREAKALDDSEHCRLVEALLHAPDDSTGALMMISDLRGKHTQTVRFAIARRTSDAAALDQLQENGLRPRAGINFQFG